MASPNEPPSSTRNTEKMLLAIRACKICGQRFTGDARFCPFDGEPLGEGARYSPESDPLVGKVIDGRYVIEAVLGQGGMGTVYRTTHKSLGRGFALKAMRADLARETDLAARFTQEAKAAASVHHPNVVEITDFGVLPTGVPYFVMELLEGEPLSRALRGQGPLSTARAVRILRQVAEGLAAAHAAGIVHRDLKPENLHLGPGDTIKILDFGVAKIAGSSRLTRTGKVFGTPHYMSPEQASGQLVDHRSDIYALGIIMYEMFTGKVPFEADTFMGVLSQQMFNAPTPPSEAAAGREIGAIEDVILKCLEKNPEHRYPNMDALIADLARVARFGDDGDVELAPSSGGGVRRSPVGARGADSGPSSLVDVAGLPKPFASRRTLVGVALGLALGGVALAAWGFFGSHGRGDRPTDDGTQAGLEARVAAPALAGPAIADAGATLFPTGEVPPRVPAAASVVPVGSSAEPIPPTTPVAAGPQVAAGRRGSGHRSSGSASGSGRTGPNGAPGAKPSRGSSGFGSGEIVNPWAQ